MAKITKRTVDALVAVNGSRQILWDDQLSGFGVRALASGQKSYVVKYRTSGGGRSSKQRWLTLGAHGHITPDQARNMAQQALAAVARGEDPQGEKLLRREAATLTALWTRYETDVLPDKKPTTRSEYKSQWTNVIEPRFGNSKVEEISRDEVDRFHKGLRHRPYRGNRILALLSHLMSLAEIWEWRPAGTNPCKGIARFKETARKRYLSGDEIGRLGTSLEMLVRERKLPPTGANAIKLLLLTGARVSEILTSRWEWLDLDRNILNLPDSKTGAKPIYLSDAALRVVDVQRECREGSEFIFPSLTGASHLVGFQKMWLRVCAHARISEVRMHDLRHTAASIGIGQGASLAIIGRLLGHTQAQTTLRYAHLDQDPAMRAANDIGNAVSAALGEVPRGKNGTFKSATKARNATKADSRKVQTDEGSPKRKTPRKKTAVARAGTAVPSASISNADHDDDIIEIVDDGKKRKRKRRVRSAPPWLSSDSDDADDGIIYIV